MHVLSIVASRRTRSNIGTYQIISRNSSRFVWHDLCRASHPHILRVVQVCDLPRICGQSEGLSDQREGMGDKQRQLQEAPAPLAHRSKPYSAEPMQVGNSTQASFPLIIHLNGRIDFCHQRGYLCQGLNRRRTFSSHCQQNPGRENDLPQMRQRTTRRLFAMRKMSVHFSSY
jgi:hypothetical protein